MSQKYKIGSENIINLAFQNIITLPRSCASAKTHWTLKLRLSICRYVISKTVMLFKFQAVRLL